MPAEKPTVSVIIPSYNHAHYVGLTIESVLGQTYDDWEAIIVDDGSTDETEAVVAQFAGPRIRYIYQENQGLAAARNTGIYAAQGEYLAFLDADDEWESEFLERCVAVLREDSSMVGVYTRNRHIDEGGAVLFQLGGQVVAPDRLRDRLIEGGFFPPCAVVVRAAVVQEVGLFDTELAGRGTEDWDLWLRIVKQHTMRGIAEPLARYRVYPGSMATNTAQMHASMIAVLTKHFGPPGGDPATWSKEKRRAYGFVYRSVAFCHIQQGQPDEGWRFLAQAVSIWPHLLERLDTLHEIACGDQPRGYRGQVALLDIGENATEIFKRLDALFAAAGAVLGPLRRQAYGNAYLALGMLSDRAGRWTAGRRYLLRAVKANPRLLGSYPVVRRLLKLCVGQWVVRLGRLRRVSSFGIHFSQSSPEA